MSGHYSIQGGDGKAALEGYWRFGKSALYSMYYSLHRERIEDIVVTPIPGI